jgi:hypothetical protein
LIKEKRKVDAQEDAINHQLAAVRERQRLIETQNQPDTTLNTHDYRTLENLNDEERLVCLFW